MGNSGSVESSIGGMTRMLTGKNFPQNTIALRMVAEELLQPIISRVESHEDLMSSLEKEATKRRGGIHEWGHNL